MTTRQRRIHERVLQEREFLVSEASKLSVGHTIVVTLTPRFIPYGYDPRMSVLLQREPTAIRYKEYGPFRRKGQHESTWRTLAAIEGTA